ncbi:uncharacterized protein LOC27208766 [Drosophila simulans]|uniref:uncharacterized protein LOC27208766 n=1 Tax=Drosophila simulans TaxID=7240 RepID=UPI00192CFCE3|nr:uncharacterized protein LOC27208766 [Drosophila simulans]
MFMSENANCRQSMTTGNKGPASRFFFFIEILPSSRLHFELPTHAEDCCKMSSVSANVGQFLWAAAKCQDAWHVRQLPQLLHPAATSPPAAGTEKAAVACHLQLSSIICQTKPTTRSPMPHCISHRQLLWQLLPFQGDRSFKDAQNTWFYAIATSSQQFHFKCPLK